MVSPDKPIREIKRATRRRLEYIELMAYYTGVVTRSDIAKTFGISDAAATKDLKFYSQIAPDNLTYKHKVFGFVPSDTFKERFADLSPGTVLPMIAANLPVAGIALEEQSIYGIPVDALPMPSRLPNKAVLAQIIRAIRGERKLSVHYRSLSDRNDQERRLIEPHSLIHTGLRWHIRAYSEDSYDFRDFVLSRIVQAQCLDESAESSAQYDDDWSEFITLELTPHPNLSEQSKMNLLLDYGVTDKVIELTVRRALVGYVLQKLSVDTSIDHTMNPNAYQLIVLNREEIEPFAGWAFL
ncbi:MAG: YafY family protein [Gammaproteobacteria bacterium]|nr:MAG: YafY family protein [Gammaproteobacteria bacterium]